MKRDLFQDHSDPRAALVAVLRYLSFHWFCSRVKRLVQGEGWQENATSYVKEQLSAAGRTSSCCFSAACVLLSSPSVSSTSLGRAEFSLAASFFGLYCCCFLRPCLAHQLLLPGFREWGPACCLPACLSASLNQGGVSTAAERVYWSLFKLE